MSALIVESGKHQGQRLTLVDDEKELVVGRDVACDIQLSTRSVSPRHCVFRSSSHGLFVRDLGSENATFVNDQPIKQETHLQPGDILRIGKMTFRVAEMPPGHVADTQHPDQSKNAENLTDSNIVDWLATVDLDSEHTDLEAAKASEAAARKKPFMSVAEEGADIIRRYLDTVDEHQQDDPSA